MSETLSIVIPVFRGESSLTSLVEELLTLEILEIVLVNDGSTDGSSRVMTELRHRSPKIKCLTLSRNFGTHAATLAGISRTTGSLIVTMDEDGLHRPSEIAKLVKTYQQSHAQLIYAIPLKPPPHGLWRNLASQFAKKCFFLFSGGKAFSTFSSFRLISGQIARKIAEQSGSHVYLDVALSWVCSSPQYCKVKFSEREGRPSSFTTPALFEHFFRLFVSSEKTPLRIVSFLGILSLLLSVALMAFFLWEKAHGRIPVRGWTSLAIIISFFSGLLLFSLGIVAEYLVVLLNLNLGRPLFLILNEEKT